MAEKVTVRYTVVHSEFPWSMNHSDFLQIAKVPEELVPDDWKPLSWGRVGNLLGRMFASFYDLAEWVDEMERLGKEVRWWGDNSYNWGWWGPTVDTKKVDLSPFTDKPETLVIIGIHLGVDVRVNYDWFAYLVPRPFNDVYPFMEMFGGLELQMEVEEEDGTTHYAWCVDVEGSRWETNDEWLEERLGEILAKAAPWDIYPRQEMEVELGEDAEE